jgi:hypothetical protein
MALDRQGSPGAAVAKGGRPQPSLDYLPPVEQQVPASASSASTEFAHSRPRRPIRHSPERLRQKSFPLIASRVAAALERQHVHYG